MTDGILLAEIQSDRSLLRYDTLIIDEAHERSLNIDFLLGYLKQLLPRRPDLKVVITSATIDPERFAQHFDDAPIVEVSGRTYPVEVRYRPAGRRRRRPDHGDLRRRRRARAGGARRRAGLPVRRARDPRHRRRAARHASARAPRCCRCTPGCRRPSSTGSSSRIAGRRVVLATNVAETSLTVPGIRYVVDPGTARISRYSTRTKVQRLPIEAISQASARQRAGRCGRVAEGVCIRLYAEEDFLGRPEYTDPEILRTNLASVILQMTAAGLGDIEDVPVRRAARPARRQGRRRPAARARRARPARARPAQAAHPGRPAARAAAGRPAARAHGARGRPQRLPARGAGHRRGAVDPGPARAAGRQAAGRRRAARALRRRDLGLPRLPQPLALRPRSSARELSSNQFRRRCKAEFLNYLRIREWQDVHSQLRQVVRSLGLRMDAPAAPSTPTASTARCSPGCCRTSACATPRSATTSVRAARASPIVPGLGAGEEAAALGHGRRAGRDQPHVGPRRRAHPAGVGRGARPSTWSSAPTASRTGRRSRPPSWPSRRSRCTASRSSRRARSTTAASTRSSRATCSCGTRSSRATGTPTTRSSPPTASCSTTSRSSSTGRAGATSSSTTQALFDFYDARIPADVVSGPALRRVVEEARGTSTPDLLDVHHGRPRRRRRGGHQRATTTRTCGCRATCGCR